MERCSNGVLVPHVQLAAPIPCARAALGAICPFLETFRGTPAMDPPRRAFEKLSRFLKLLPAGFPFSFHSDAQSESIFFLIFFPRKKKTRKFFGGRFELHALLLLGLASSSRCAVTDPYGAFTVKSFAPKSSVPFRAIRGPRFAMRIQIRPMPPLASDPKAPRPVSRRARLGRLRRASSFTP